ncbi:MAG: TylF/MycF family methyltransferase, partial [Rubrobacteraceae bacterium]
MVTVPGNKFSLSPEHEARARINSRADLRWLNNKFGTDLYPDIFEDAPLKEAVRAETLPRETVDALAINLSNLGNELERQKLRGGKAGVGPNGSDLEKALQETREQLKGAQRQANDFRRQLRTNDRSTELYLDLIKRCVSGWIHASPALRANENFVTRPMGALGENVPDAMHSMLGFARLDNLRFCVESVIEDDIPGDLIETGVWRGGGTIFMRAILKAYGVTDRTVWVADSFEGLPPPNAEKYVQDAGDIHHTLSHLAVSLEEVKANFEGYGLLDEQVRFLKGWFRDTLPGAPVEKLAVLRLDGDMYESTMDALTNLYPKLSVGGYLIVDDYGAVQGCKEAVHDYRRDHGVEEEMVAIDWAGVYWRKSHRGVEDVS